MNAKELALRCAACLQMVADNEGKVDESIRDELMESVNYTLRLCLDVMNTEDTKPPNLEPGNN
ncbi:hypothetical protein LOC67_23300 [Stieleria sp. JC731]|uniref:hypothetical protein n=1 Tax=Pirellulaceae TaxID=2691357 RepID=UPI001E5736DC|nr:hypothetical protein [Stieleria sp. JC731]MCC9603486.1 hypothetical protein [Stieleria sp. JC731]